jgi:hypothetical protein
MRLIRYPLKDVLVVAVHFDLLFVFESYSSALAKQFPALASKGRTNQKSQF